MDKCPNCGFSLEGSINDQLEQIISLRPLLGEVASEVSHVSKQDQLTLLTKLFGVTPQLIRITLGAFRIVKRKRMKTYGPGMFLSMLSDAEHDQKLRVDMPELEGDNEKPTD